MIKRPLITEKSTTGNALNRYTFEVERSDSKKEIAKSIEKGFAVHVKSIRTVNLPGKSKNIGFTRKKSKKAGIKKAIVQLAAGEKIDLFETGD